VANRRIHAETHQSPIERFEAGGPHRQAEAERLRDAFRWSVTARSPAPPLSLSRATPTQWTPPWSADASSCATNPKT
jgi:hypothetical protein